MTKATGITAFVITAAIILGAYLIKAPIKDDWGRVRKTSSIGAELPQESVLVADSSKLESPAPATAGLESPPVLAVDKYPRTDFREFLATVSIQSGPDSFPGQTARVSMQSESGETGILPAAYMPGDLEAEDTGLVNQNMPSTLSVLNLSASDIQMAGSHINYGKTLARKGATYSARNEFIKALAVIAQSFDMQSGNKEYSSALGRGLKAIVEADDFHTGTNGANFDPDVASIVEGHLSRVITRAEADQWTRAQALQAYYGYAQQEITYACGRNNWLASEALYAMGRLHGILGQASAGTQPREKAKAMVMHTLALETWPQNFASANDLGVLRAGNGDLAAARDLLARSAALHPHPEIWMNLANVHRQLGEFQLAELAQREAQLGATDSLEAERADGLIRWVAAVEFESAPQPQEAEPSVREASQEPDAKTKTR